MLVSVMLAVGAAGVAGILGYKKLNKKKDKILKEGDYALLRHSYYQQYPRVPKNHAVTVDKIEGDMATIFFMEPSEIRKEQVKKEALRRVS
jgi:hypothetical protein